MIKLQERANSVELKSKYMIESQNQNKYSSQFQANFQ